MKQGSRLLSVGLGMTLIVGSMFAFSGTAHAARGDLVIAAGGTFDIGGIITTVTTGAGTGITGANVSPWNSNVPVTMTGTVLPGGLNCISASIIVPTDVITWNGANTGTQTMSDAQFTFNSTGCPFPPQGICVVTLNGPTILTTAVGGFPLAGNFRSGVFDAGPTPVNSVTISEGPGNTCLASGFAALIAGTLNIPVNACTAPILLPKTCLSSAPFSASLTKTLQVLP